LTFFTHLDIYSSHLSNTTQKQLSIVITTVHQELLQISSPSQMPGEFDEGQSNPHKTTQNNHTDDKTHQPLCPRSQVPTPNETSLS
jgi:hypothetical protein